MLVSLKWLKEYVDYGDISPEKLSELITRSGIEVDGLHYITNEKSEKIVVGYVAECDQHPNADKLKLCQVDVGEERLQIICGAANVAQGQKVVVAKPGAVLPGNFNIKKVKLRGIESNGMICSLQELGVDEAYIPEQFAEGIAVLDEEAEVGTSVDEMLNLDDAVLEFDLTPNRADALSMIGVAHEVAAILDKNVELPDVNVNVKEEKATDYISVDVEDADLCSYYGAFIVKNLKVKPSPLWMQNRLLTAGIRPINNVVDITNYILMEYGQPLHAFDYDLLDSKEIVVRRAKDDEKIVTLDGKERSLKNEHLLITNGKEGIALAGVMGGANTEVNDETTTVLVEAAFFDPLTVRKAAQYTGLRSDASSRFEKGIDPNRVFEAGLRACQLLEHYADGEVLTGVAEYDKLDRSEKTVDINTTKINKRLGTDLSTENIANILRKLQFSYDITDEDFVVNIPTRRNDITIFEDMVEEIARIYGYDNLPYTLPKNASKPGGLTDVQLMKRKIGRFLQGVGLKEALTYSLVSKKDVNRLQSPDVASEEYNPVSLAMPLSEDHQYLRLSLLPELLNRLSYNRARKQEQLSFYEIGSIFLSKEEEVTKQPKEELRLAGALTGEWIDHKWQADHKSVDFYLVKGIVEELFNYIDVEVEFIQDKLDDMHPGRTALLSVNGETIGFIGQVHPLLAKEKDLKDTYVFELNLEYILNETREELIYDPIPKYPSNARDVAFVVKKDLQAGDIQKEIKKIGAPLVKSVDVFDVYVGGNLNEDEKSVAYNLIYQDVEKTLTDKEVDESFKKIIEHIEKAFDAHIRR